MILRRASAAVSPRLLRASSPYLVLTSIASRRTFSASTIRQSQYDRSDFTGQGFSSFYEPDQPTRGPLGGTSNVGESSITPKLLKKHLDQFVVDQDRAKVVLSVAVHEHYLRIQELQRWKDEQTRLDAQAQRRASAFRHPVEDEFPGQQPTVELYPNNEHTLHHESSMYTPPRSGDLKPAEIFLNAGKEQPQIDKSNVLILGPSGVGKTLMCKTLAKTLGLPISMSDCTTFTQAGYVGDDVESCVARLFSASNYDIEATEHGIIVLDEIDKIAGAKVSYGKDVGGEGVQQALLKIIEGTTVQVQAKPERSSSRPGSASGRSSPMDGSQNPTMPGGGGKGEVYNIRTENILFICTGAFSNLHKIVLDRKAKGSMGFGATIRASNAHAAADGVMLSGNEAKMFKDETPFFLNFDAETSDHKTHQDKNQPEKVNILDHVQPADLQKYGMIPELIGRIPTVCAVSALNEEALVRVLTEPKGSLVEQEEHKAFLKNMELRFTSGALQEIARKASKMGTGARGLRHVVEQLLLQAKYETPGSTVKHILVTRDAALLKRAPMYFHRGQSNAFQAALDQDEDKWWEEVRSKEDLSSDTDGHVGSFEEYRKAGAGF